MLNQLSHKSFIIYMYFYATHTNPLTAFLERTSANPDARFGVTNNANLSSSHHHHTRQSPTTPTDHQHTDAFAVDEAHSHNDRDRNGGGAPQTAPSPNR
jgi:hypothetical protein